MLLAVFSRTTRHENIAPSPDYTASTTPTCAWNFVWSPSQPSYAFDRRPIWDTCSDFQKTGWHAGHCSAFLCF